jgi:hypothetical protein
MNPNHCRYIAEKFSDARRLLMLPYDEANAIEAALIEISLVLSPPYLNEDDPDIDSEVATQIRELRRIMSSSRYKNVTPLERLEYGTLGVVARRIRHPKKQRLAELVDDLADHFKRQCH